MFFSRSKTVRVQYISAENPSQAIGFDELKGKQLPVDFTIPTEVEIDGKMYVVKATDPLYRKEAMKAGSLKVWVEAKAVVAEPAEDHVDEVAEVADEVLTEQVQATVIEATYFPNASCPAAMPRLSGKRGEYEVVEVLPRQWRQLEFVRKELGPEIGEEFTDIQAIHDQHAVEENGHVRFTRQYVRELTHIPLRGFQDSDTHLQGKFFPFGTRKDGVAFMGDEAFIDGGYAYVLPSGLALYGQEFDNKLLSLCLTTFGTFHAENLDEDVAALQAMMADTAVVLVDWDALEAVEADASELKAYVLKYLAG